MNHYLIKCIIYKLNYLIDKLSLKDILFFPINL